MVSRFFACAGVGGFFTLAACVLAIFAHIGQITDNVVPRNIRMVTIDTSGVGAASGAGSSLYGSGARNSANTGLRTYYEWGLWNYCEKNGDVGASPDFCTGTSWANSFQPLPAILYDVPTTYQTQVANVLPSSTFTDTDYLTTYSKAAFYLLIIGTIFGGLALIVGFLAHRFAYLIAALFCLMGFLCSAVGCVIWTVIIAKTRNLNGGGSGLVVSYGVALWLYWASTGALLLAILPFIFSCIAGRDRDYYY